MEFASSDYQTYERTGSVNISLVLSGQVVSQSFIATVIATACTASSSPAAG